MAQAELDQLGDLHRPQYRYENYAPDSFAVQGVQSIEQPQGDGIKRGCMVPFEMFVLRARLQGYLGDIYEAIDQLYDLIMRSKKVRLYSQCCSGNQEVYRRDVRPCLAYFVTLTFTLIV